ncbi:MAG TPA: DUF2779 domain-containing protein, partial [Gammaproteobacteria bacterium]|nr:DUF2779 domain-containing protein [Gammaproteobacteria bacterium]
LNTTGIKEGLSNWQFPLVFLDFETANPAIPRYIGCTPYQHVPFQFSVHIWNDPESDLEHHEFLWTTLTDPRPSLIPALLKACGKQGSIVAYYSLFEAGRIEELAEFAPEYAEDLLALNQRLVDPLPIIRNNIYDNAFEGSFSLKKVASALLGQAHSYDNMVVANGGDAQRAFEAIITNSISENEKQALIKALLEYCKKDTLEVVELVKWLYQQVNMLE